MTIARAPETVTLTAPRTCNDPPCRERNDRSVEIACWKPRFASQIAWRGGDHDAARPPRLMRITEFLRLDLAAS
ncbi:hypothetical protein [Nocardia mikamii]|uniref:hypothetical protein n=1 Tax=Nocardia mikamii TaxID=508464 RepID=UPI0007A4B80F|nr:hypothetical protein [Nocardia mikamii]